MSLSLAPSVSAILVAGDWHRQTWAAADAINLANRLQIDTILQVGDFGYDEARSDGVSFLDFINDYARQHGVTIIWLDGNHENHPLLWSKYANAERSKEGFWEIRSNVWYSPRANAWEWWGKRLMTVGGAFSIDRGNRVLGSSWWLEEEITLHDVDRARRRGKVDYLFTHDAPTSIPFRGVNIHDSYVQRTYIDKILDATRPRALFHGHYHRLLNYYYPVVDPFTNVYGLDKNGETGNLATLDLTTGEVTAMMNW
jgi:hypothetical protein